MYLDSMVYWKRTIDLPIDKKNDVYPSSNLRFPIVTLGI